MLLRSMQITMPTLYLRECRAFDDDGVFNNHSNKRFKFFSNNSKNIIVKCHQV